MAMVHAATHAYEHKEGWADDAPPTDAYPQEQHLVAADPVKPRDAPEEFYKAPPKQGYFYANNKVSALSTDWVINFLSKHKSFNFTYPRVEVGKEHEIYAAAFGGHLFL